MLAAVAELELLAAAARAGVVAADLRLAADRLLDPHLLELQAVEADCELLPIRGRFDMDSDWRQRPLASQHLHLEAVRRLELFRLDPPRHTVAAMWPNGHLEHDPAMSVRILAEVLKS